MPTQQQLQDYLTTDPDGLGISGMWSLDHDEGITAVLNDRSKGGTISAVEVGRGALLAVFAGPVILTLPTLATNLQQRWQLALQMLQAGDSTIKLLNADGSPTPIRQLFEQAVADGLLTEPEVVVATTRPGSPAEKNWGAGTTITQEQVNAAVPAAVLQSRHTLQEARLAKEQEEVEIRLFAEIKAHLDHHAEAGQFQDPVATSGPAKFTVAQHPLTVMIENVVSEKARMPTDDEIAELARAERKRMWGGD